MVEERLKHIEIRHLEALRAVVEEGTFTDAGIRLGYSQAAVSQQVAALEAALGESVFDRPGGATAGGAHPGRSSCAAPCPGGH